MSGALRRPFEFDELAAVIRPLTAVLSLDELPRFVEALELEQDEQAQVNCTLVPRKVAANTVEVSGSIQASVKMRCQRCLDAVQLELLAAVDWSFTSADAQHAAGAKNGGAGIDLLTWVEDELLLSLPQFPTHAPEHCNADGMIEYMSEGSAGEEEPATPFADLKNLLSEKKPS